MYFGAILPEADASGPLEEFCRTLGEVTALEVRPRRFDTGEALLDDVGRGRVEIAWAPPLLAIELEDRGTAAPLVVVERTARRGYHSALIVRTDSGITRPEDLHHASVAWVSEDSASGYRVPRWHLRSAGIDVRYAFASERCLGSHTAVVRAVVEHESDVGATYATLDPRGRLISSRWLEADVDRDSVRVIALVGPIPNDVIVAGTRVRPSERSRLLAALVSFSPADGSRAHALFQAVRFDPASATHFSVLRDLMERGGDTNARA